MVVRGLFKLWMILRPQKCAVIAAIAIMSAGCRMDYGLCRLCATARPSREAGARSGMRQPQVKWGLWADEC